MSRREVSKHPGLRVPRPYFNQQPPPLLPWPAPYSTRHYHLPPQVQFTQQRLPHMSVQIPHPQMNQPLNIQQQASVFYRHTQEQRAIYQHLPPAPQFQQQAPLYRHPGPEHGIVTRDEGWYPEIFKDRVELILDQKDIEVDLTTQNYRKKFNSLVCWEEKSNIEILGRKCDRKCDLTLFHCGDPPSWIRSKYKYKQPMRYGFLVNVTADQIAYATQASEAVFVVSRNRRLELRMEILQENYRHSDEKLYVAFREDESDKLSRIISSRSLPQGEVVIYGLLIEFEVKHEFFNSLVKAVNSMHKGIIQRLLPVHNAFVLKKLVPEFDLKFLLSNIPDDIKIDTNSQFKALRSIFSCDRDSPPLIISGSFGTGKTRLLAVATHCLIQNGMRFKIPVKILVCAHHYHSVNHFIDQYFGKMFSNEKNVALFRLISESYRVGDSQYSNLYVTASSILGYVCTHDYVLVVTEFLSAQPLLKMLGVGFFTHILVDEGSQIVEPQAVAALNLAGPATKIVIVGDSCQVGPSLSVLGKESRENGLKYSLQERLETLYTKFGGCALEHMVSLTTNYRCHESIIQISNELFYGKKIKSLPLNALPHHLAEFPLLFVCSSLTNDVDRDLEAKLLMDGMEHFVLSNWPKDRWGERDWSKICLTTASQTQLVITRTLSRKRYPGLSQHINILTAYRIQGNEYQAVFVSTTEPVDSEGNTTNPTKSPCDPYVFNTVLTRSKSLVVVVGSPLALLGIEEHMVRQYGNKGRCWSNYLNLCMEKNTFIIPSEIESDEKIIKGYKSTLKKILSNRLSKTVPDTDIQERSSIPNSQKYSDIAKISLKSSKSKKVHSSKAIKSPVLSNSQASLAKVPTNDHKSSFQPLSPQVITAGTLPGYRRQVANSNRRFPDVSLASSAPGEELSNAMTVPSASTSSTSASNVNQSKAVATSETPLYYAPEDTERLLKEKLTTENYRDKFHVLLDAEKQEHSVQLEKRCDGIYKIQLFEADFVPSNLSHDNEAKYVQYGCITSENVDALTYAKQASESSLITVSNTNCIVHSVHVQATVPKWVFSNAIMIAFDEEQFDKLKAGIKRSGHKFKARVKFEMQEAYFSMLHKALQNIPREVVVKLNPSKEAFSSFEAGEFFPVSKPPYDSIELDEVQMNALYLILKASSNFPVLIAGSFGTGKTRLLARAAYEILKRRESRVLICAHHQTSVDTFVHYFNETKSSDNNSSKVWAVNMIRVMPNDSYSSRTRDQFNINFKSRQSLSQDDLENCQLILTTFSSASYLYWKVKPKQRKGFFSDILIDEGAQVREPEMVGALTLAGPETKIVIAGDHLQVGPNMSVLGEVAQANGLGVSPLERLHKKYDKAKSLLSKSCSATLLTNYRCHSSILMLPSSLYYESSLVSRADNTTHRLAPFPLNFVCTDIQQQFQGTSGVNEQEADALIKEVEKYLDDWPKQWKATARKICIMTPSPNQLNVLKRKANHLISKRCEVLPAYKIQGTEFEAIFISTSEATTEACEPFDATKSICDRFVFNTALTRSRSLVVAFGNPFFLLKIEENMIKKHNSSYKTWKPYIKQCLECDSFSYSSNIKKSAINLTTQQLYELVYSDSVKLFNLTALKNQDSILKSYQQKFKGIKGCKRTKLILSSSRNDDLTWTEEDDNDNQSNQDEEPTEKKIDYSDHYICQLKFLNYRTVEAVPVSDTSKKDVLLQGKKNIRNAFDGDTAIVGIFDDCPPNKQYGRVLQVLKRGSNLRFVCRVADYSPIIFFPIDRKNPKLVNLPMLSRVILQKETREQKYQYNDVIVFDPKFDIDGLPQVAQVIPHSVAQRMLFVVSFLMWKRKYAYPLGIVIGMCSLGHTFLKAELLLKMEHSVVYNSEGDGLDSVHYDVITDSDLPTYHRAFTIDPSNAQNLDDAVSITSRGMNTHSSLQKYELGVHIAYVAKHITLGSDEDKAAKELGISVYGENKRGKMMHMIQNRHTRQSLSLVPEKLRDVLSVTCSVTITTGSQQVEFEATSISPSQVRSAFKLSYEQAQELLKNKIPEEHAAATRRFDEDQQNPSLCKSMNLLYTIARALRHSRLKSDSEYVFDVDDPEERKNWQAHLLVSELMIWANNEVAKKIHSDFPNASVLCKQVAPPPEKLERFIEQNKDTISASLQFSQYLAVPNAKPVKAVALPCNLLEWAKAENNYIFLAHLLSSERLYPQLAVAASKFLTISKRSVYCCTDEEETDPSAYRHYSLCLDEYTNFTSPIRRYVDIVVQRLLMHQFDYSHDELEELCSAFNKFKRNASSYEKAIKRVRLASNLMSNSEACTAYVTQQHPTSVELSFHDIDLKYKDLPITSKKLDTHRCFPHSKDTDVYAWKLRVTSLSNGFASKLLQIPGFSVKQNSASTTISPNTHLLKVFCSSDETVLDIQEYLVIPHDQEVLVPPQSWLEIQKFIKMPTKKKASQVKKILNNLSIKQSLFHPISNAHYLFLDCDVKLPLKEADPVKLWLSWSTKEPVISPVIQLLEVSPLLRICVQHNTHPADCFSDPNLELASLERYSCLEHYTQLWKKVLLAEAAVKSVNECQPIVIQGVNLEWPELETPENCIEVQYYIPIESTKMVLPAYFTQNCSEFFQLRVGDLVCARYGYDNPRNDQDKKLRAVYHFVVHDVQEPETAKNKGKKRKSDKSETVILLETIGQVNCRVTDEIRKKLKSKEDKFLCEIQIVPMSISYRKVFSGLLAITDSKECQLSKNVAVHTCDIRQGQVNYPKYTKDIEDIKKDELSMSISKWDSEFKSMSLPEFLNRGQEKAVNKALNNQFQLIQGPPGTGKSVTGAHIAYVFAKLNRVINTQNSQKCVLYCGPSNKSVDVVFKKFVELLQARSDVVRILRIYSSAVERKDFPGPRHQTQQALPDNACPDWAREHSLHHLIRHHDNTEEEFVELKRLEKKLADMVKNKKIASGKLCNEYRKALNKAEEKFLSRKKFDIIFCTCNEASGGRMKRHQRQLTPRQCIIDECGMAYEPETIVPISLCEHAVLIGDHKQLQPVIEYQPARKYGLSTSLFERYATYYDDHIYTLKTQYRMHEAICAFPSERFYNKKLKTDKSVLNRKENEDLASFWPNGNKFPIMFVDVVGEEEQDIDSDKREAKVGVESKYNKKEAELVINIARTLHCTHKLPLSEIAILTPYSAQKNKILKMVKPDTVLKDLKVASITESQGDEYGYVILSTVRSLPMEEIRNKDYVQPDRSWIAENLGFITDDHQINVGITRSKYGLVITGNKTLLEYNKTWKKLLMHYEERKCVVDETHFCFASSKSIE